MQDKTKTLESLTKLSIESQNQKLRIFARVDIETKLKILIYQKQIFHKLKSHHSQIDNDILTLSSLIVSISDIVSLGSETILKLSIFRAKNARKKAKRGRILELWSIVIELKNEQKMSFRDISKYLKKYHKFDVAHSTIFSIWQEIQNENKETEK